MAEANNDPYYSKEDKHDEGDPNQRDQYGFQRPTQTESMPSYPYPPQEHYFQHGPQGNPMQRRGYAYDREYPFPGHTEQYISSYQVKYSGESRPYPTNFRGQPSFQHRFPIDHPQFMHPNHNVPYLSEPYNRRDIPPYYRGDSGMSKYLLNSTDDPSKNFSQKLNDPQTTSCVYSDCKENFNHSSQQQHQSLADNTESQGNHQHGIYSGYVPQHRPHEGQQFFQREPTFHYEVPNTIAAPEDVQNVSSLHKDIKALTTQVSELQGVLLEFMKSTKSEFHKFEEKIETLQQPISKVLEGSSAAGSGHNLENKNHVAIQDNHQLDRISEKKQELMFSQKLQKKTVEDRNGTNHSEFSSKDVLTKSDSGIQTSGTSTLNSENQFISKTRISGLSQNEQNSSEETSRIFCETTSGLNQRYSEQEVSSHSLALDSIKDLTQGYFSPTEEVLREGVSLLTNEIGQFFQTPVFSDDRQELEKYAHNTSGKNFTKGLAQTLLDVIERQVKKKTDDPRVSSLIHCSRNLIDKLIVDKPNRDEVMEYICEDYVSTFAKKNEGIEFFKTLVNNIKDDKDNTKKKVDYFIDAYDSTQTPTQTNKCLNYRTYCPSSVLKAKTTEYEIQDTCGENTFSISELTDEKANASHDEMYEHDSVKYIQEDKDVSSDESYHSGDEIEEENNHMNMSMTQLLTELEEMNNPKYLNQISTSTIWLLGKRLSDSDCRQVAKYLGVPEQKINDTEIRIQNNGGSRTEFRENLLTIWHQKFGNLATDKALIRGLFFAERADLVNLLFPDFVKDNPCLNREIVSRRIKLSPQEYTNVLRKIQLYLKSAYANVLLPVTPWLEHKILRLDELYVDLKMFPKNDCGQEDIGKEIILEEIFLKVQNEYPYRILVEGPPGYGKSTFACKIALDFSKNETYLKRFHLVFIIALRYFNGDLEQILMDECRLEKITNDVKLAVIRHFEKHVLLILDGYDELSDEHKTSLSPLLKGEKYSRMTVLLTSRTGLFKLPSKEEQGSPSTGGLVEMSNKKHKHFWRKRIEIKGISTEKRELFLKKYLQVDVKNLYEKLAHVMTEEMKNLYECPLVLLLLAMMIEEKGAEKITSKTDLYKQVFNFIVRRSLMRQSLISKQKEIDLFRTTNGEFYFQLMLKLGEFALQKLTKHTLMFREEEIVEFCNNDKTVLKLGFLTKNIKISKHSLSEFYEPVHKTFLEFLAAFRLWILIKESKTGSQDLEFQVSSLMREKILDQKDSLLFIFLAGLLEEKTSVLLEAFNPWSYKLSAYEFPITDIMEESKCMDKLFPYVTPFIPCIFHHKYEFFTSNYNSHVLNIGVQQNQIKVVNLNVHQLIGIPIIDYVEVVQLDIWGKDIDKSLSFRKNFAINCKHLVCWFYGITVRNWEYYANIILSINSEYISLIVNAYDDYNQLQLILDCINDELRDGKWQNLNIKFLKVLGLDGKNDRKSLHLIENIIKTGKIQEGLTVVVKSIMGTLETLSFWFKTRFLKAIRELAHKFSRHLHSIASFREHFKSNIDEITFEIDDGIKNIISSFEATLRRLAKDIHTSSSKRSDDSSGDEADPFKYSYKVGSAEEKMKNYAKEIQVNCNLFLNDFGNMLNSVEKDRQQLLSFSEDLHNIFHGFCKYLDTADSLLINSDDESDDDVEEEGLNLKKVLHFAKHTIQHMNLFMDEMNSFTDVVSKSNLVHFSLDNGYCNTLHTPCVEGKKYFTDKEWKVLHLRNKIVIEDARKSADNDYKINNFRMTHRRGRYTKKDLAAVLRCQDLYSFSCSSALLKKIKDTKVDWKGFETVKQFQLILEEENFNDSDKQILENFNNLELLRINFESVSKTFDFEEFPYLPFRSLKTLEIYEIDYENINFVKAVLNSLSKQDFDQEWSRDDVLNLEVKLDLSKIFDESDVEEIYIIAKNLLIVKIVKKLTLVKPNEPQEMLITNVFSFSKEFIIRKDIAEFEAKELLFSQQEKLSSNDIRMEIIICKN